MASQQLYDVGHGRKMWPNTEVAGEFAYEAAIVKTIGGRPHPGRDVELEDVPVTLVPEPGNIHDRNAVAIGHQGLTVGYLTRDDAKRFKQPLARIAASGAVPATTARIWASIDEWGGNKKFRSRITVALPEPEMMLPLNAPPAGEYNLIPWGNGLQVIKEEDHFDILFHHVPPSGEGIIFVSLHKGTRTLKNGTEKPFVEIRVDGERVGEMSGATSGHFLPTVEHIESIGEVPAALAKITGSALAAQLVLHGAKAPELSDSWLANSPNQVPRLLPWAESYELADTGAHRTPATSPRAAAQPTPDREAVPRAADAPVVAPLGSPATARRLQTQGRAAAKAAFRTAFFALLAAGLLFLAAFLTVGINSLAKGDTATGVISLIFAAGLVWGGSSVLKRLWRKSRPGDRHKGEAR